MQGYPISLNLKDKSVVVIGGGRVAFRKVNRLLEVKANVTVVSPILVNSLQDLVKQGHITWIKDSFNATYLQDAQIIFATTNDRDVNKLIYQSKKPNQWINIADDPELSDFHIPSSFTRGRLTIAVSTHGASPILAKKIKRELEEIYDYQYESFLEFLYIVREKVKKQVTDEIIRKEILSELILMDTFDISKLIDFLKQQNIHIDDGEWR